MKVEESPARWESWIAPKSMFCGVLLAFAACCWAGRQGAEDSVFRHFERFHQRLTPESLFYPTVSQCRQHVLHHVSRKKVLVLVGGSSVMQGTGVPVDDLWTNKLQELLGDGYRVVNFGFRAAQLQDFGLVVAKSLSKSRPKMIFISDVPANYLHAEPDGLRLKYFYWDARFKGLLPPEPAADLVMKEHPSDERREIQRGAWLDGRFYFNDFWNSLAYTMVSTPWSFLVSQELPFYTPRVRIKDRDGEQHLPPRAEEALRTAGGIANRGFVQAPDGVWRKDDRYWKTFRTSAECILPEAIRGQTLLVTRSINPLYEGRLAPEERERLSEGRRSMHSILDSTGIRCLHFESALPEDYADILHPSISGGVKLAEQVAPTIRQMATELGYVTPKP